MCEFHRICISESISGLLWTATVLIVSIPASLNGWKKPATSGSGVSIAKEDILLHGSDLERM